VDSSIKAVPAGAGGIYNNTAKDAAYLPKRMLGLKLELKFG
jgi:hypothetical protein